MQGTLTVPHLQPYDVIKWLDPAALFYNYEGDEFCRMKGQRMGMISRRTARIRENLPPRLKFSEGRDLDLAEKVFPGTRNPGFGDKAAIFERLGFIG